MKISNLKFNTTLMDSGEGDMAANQQLRRHTRCAIAMHYGSPPPMTALKEDRCDGFVIGGATNRAKADAAVAAMANKPFFAEQY